jgi:putative phosphoribosyl transferase
VRIADGPGVDSQNMGCPVCKGQNTMNGEQALEDHPMQIDLDTVILQGNLSIPSRAEAIVLFAHGSGSSRHSPRNRFVAQMLRAGGLATLLTDLLTPEEEEIDMRTRRLRFDIDLLALRVIGLVDWLTVQPYTKDLNIGCFGSSTGAAACLMAAKERPNTILAVVSRGGRTDLAASALPAVEAPTLLIVGGNDFPVVGLNRDALERLRCEKRLEVIPDATHLFPEEGALENVSILAREWFRQHLTTPSAAAQSA